MIPILSFDSFEDDETSADCFVEDLEWLAKNLLEKHEKISVDGNVGMWDGPHAVRFYIDNELDFRRFVSQGDVIELSFVDEDVTVSELQRYSSQWSVDAKVGCIILKQWHHDGCNIFFMRPMDNDETSDFTLDEMTI